MFALLLSLLLVLASTCHGFQYSYGTSNIDSARGVLQTSSPSGYLIAGYTSQNSFGSVDGALIKTSNFGTIQWAYNYGGRGADVFESVTRFTSSNRIYYAAVGRSSSYNPGGLLGINAYLVITDSNGRVVDSGVYGGRNNDGAHCIQSVTHPTDGPGLVFVGESNSYPNLLPGNNIYIVRTDLRGNLRRAAVIGGPGNQVGNWVIQTSDGGYVVVGYTTRKCSLLPSNRIAASTENVTAAIDQAADVGEDERRAQQLGFAPQPLYTNQDIYVVKLDKDFSVTWTKVIGSRRFTPSRREVATSVVEDTSDRAYVITGHTSSFGEGSYDIFILKLRASDGSLQWFRTYGNRLGDFAHSIILDRDARNRTEYVVTGGVQTPNASFSTAYLLKTSRNGDLVWVRHFGRPASSELNYQVIRADNGYATVGYVGPPSSVGSLDIKLIKTDRNGQSQSPCQQNRQLNTRRHTPCSQSTGRAFRVDQYRKVNTSARANGYQVRACRN